MVVEDITRFETSAVVSFSFRVFFDRKFESSARAADKAWHRGRRLGYHNAAMCSILGHRCSIYTNLISVLSGIFLRSLFALIQVTALTMSSCS